MLQNLRWDFYLCRHMKKLLSFDLGRYRKYFSEKNALTVMASIFCLGMTIIGIVKGDLWLAVAFALAFSFAIEVICHRSKERN